MFFLRHLYSGEIVWRVTAHGQRCYIKQVATAASAKHLLTLGKMSAGQRVSKPLKGLSQLCEKPG